MLYYNLKNALFAVLLESCVCLHVSVCIYQSLLNLFLLFKQMHILCIAVFVMFQFIRKVYYF